VRSSPLAAVHSGAEAAHDEQQRLVARANDLHCGEIGFPIMFRDVRQGYRRPVLCAARGGIGANAVYAVAVSTGLGPSDPSQTPKTRSAPRRKTRGRISGPTQGPAMTPR
jgi:hypothetical protein